MFIECKFNDGEKCVFCGESYKKLYCGYGFSKTKLKERTNLISEMEWCPKRKELSPERDTSKSFISLTCSDCGFKSVFKVSIRKKAQDYSCVNCGGKNIE